MKNIKKVVKDKPNQKKSDKSVNKRFPVLVEALLMLFVPIIGFVLFSYVLYPLQPHCSLGDGLLGCAPSCVMTNSGMYEKTPCFHDNPTSMQSFSYKQPFPYYLLFLLPLSLILVLVGTEKFYNAVLKILFYPYYLFKNTRKETNFIYRLIATLFFIPLTIEWLLGYGVLITTILGINLFQ